MVRVSNSILIGAFAIAGTLSTPGRALQTENPCVEVDTTIDGSSLEGKLWQGQEITVLGWGCGVPERYDYVVFRTKENRAHVIKQVWGMPGDSVSVQQNGRFLINDTEAKTPFGKPYVLLGSARTRFEKLSEPLDGYLVLGHPGSVDSARLGIIQSRNILGYVPRGTVD